MIGNIRLYKSLGLKQDNTMYFASLQDQQTFFNAPPNVQFTDYENVSYNGARAFKININFLSFMFLEYDYLRFEFPNGDGTTRTIYAFIDDIEYVNDNCCAIQSTIDLMQTFMFEIFDSYQYGIVKNYTLKQNDFLKYIPYSNKFPVSDYSISKLLELSPNVEDGLPKCGWVVVTIDPKGDTNKLFQHYCYDNGVKLPFIKLAFPVNYDKGFIETYTFQKPDGAGGQMKIINYSRFMASHFFETMAPYILDMSFLTTNIADESFTKSSLENRININYSTDYFNLIPIDVTGSGATEYSGFQILKNKHNQKSINLNNTNSISLMRLPYTHLKIGNGFSNIDINLLDFFDGDAVVYNGEFTIDYITSLTFPTQISLSLSFNNKSFVPVNTPLIVGASENMIYSTSAWSTYVSQNKQWANSGLATQQKYDTRILNRELQGENEKGLFRGLLGLGVAGISTAKGSVKGVVDSGLGIFRNSTDLLVGVNTKQAVQKIEQEKDRAMQQIQFNDIKTAPSEFDNLTSPITTQLNAVDYSISVYLYTARNINDVKKYHEIYGYEINKTLDNFSFTSIRNHENFDYISFVSLFIKANIPRDMEETIEQILTNGVRFWYDYTKFLDYSLPNNEVT